MTTTLNGLHVCPYNNSHMVEWQKLPNHLVRCRKNNPGLLDKIDICPYNQCHHVPKTEMEKHLSQCEDHHTFKAISLKPASFNSLAQRFPVAVGDDLRQGNSCPSKANGSKSAPIDTRAMKQRQKNLEDLDEWLVE